MFKLQNWKTKLVYIGFGSFFGCLCAIIGMLASPVRAQYDKFDTIQCSRLEIVDAVGQKDVVLGSSEHGGYVHVYGKGEDKKTAVLLLINERGAHIAVTSRYAKSSVILGATQNGHVHLYGKDGKPAVELGINEHGNGVVNVSDKDGTTVAGLLVLKHGGAVSVSDKDGKPTALLGVDENGGLVRVWSKDEVLSSILGVNEHGGIVGVYGKGEGAAAMGINEYGNGVISTWDKNGYRQ